MKANNPKSFFLLIALMLVHCIGFGLTAFQNSNLDDAKVAYADVTSFDDGFVAITNSGRIDWISEEGVVSMSKTFEGESFKSILAIQQQFLILSSNGQILLFENDSSFHTIHKPSNNTINCITLFKNRIIAGCDEGELLIGNNENSLKSIQLELKGNMVSLSAGINDCWGVSDQGEIIHSKDGLNWIVFDFNSVYKAYYKACSFIKVECTPDQIAVIGKNSDGSPVLFFSSKGNVWSERVLNYTSEEGAADSLNDIPTDICYDAANDQFLLTCANGRLMTIPSCSHCQKVYQISLENLNAIAGNESKIMVVGTNNFVQMMNVIAF